MDPKKKTFTISPEEKQILLRANGSITEFLRLICLFDEQQINIIPFDGSWTGGQLARHLIKSHLGCIKLLKGSSKETVRKSDKMVKTIEGDMLNFDIKTKASDNVAPEITDYNRAILLADLEEIKSELNKIILSLDLKRTCVLFPFPVYGKLTRLEVIYFIIYHTERHNQQLSNILEKINVKQQISIKIF